MGKWSDLPAELVMAIEQNVALYVDKVRFRSVCLFWNSRVEKVPNQQETCFPWLLQTHDSNKISSHGLFNPIDQRVYELYLPNSQGKIFKGSSHGWVISVEEGNNLYLISPLNGTQIKLPPRTKFPDVKNYRANKPGNEYGLLNRKGNAIGFGDCSYANINLMEKIVLSSPPSHEDCIAIAIYGEYYRLAYCKRNDSKWTFLYGNYHVSFADLIFHKGKLHALTLRGEILVFESVSPKSKVTKIVSSPTPYPVGYCLYLVESSDGGLIMVARHVDCHAVEGEKGTAYNTSGFIVYKHNPSNSSWFVVKNIGDDVIFLGFNSSFSISSSSCPFTAYKKNHIYFTDNMTDFHREDNERGGDLGVFNLEDESIQSLPGFKSPKLNWPPPVWVTPTPRQLN